MKTRWHHAVTVLALAAAALLVVRAAPYVGFRRPPVERPGGSVVRGAMHVHLPDNPDEFRDLIEAAQTQQMDFLIFTTGGGLDAAGERREGYYTVHGSRSGDPPPILVLIAAEAPTDRGNLLLLGGDVDATFPLTRRSPVLARTIRRFGGVAVALGPCAGDPPQEARASPANPDPPENVTGVESMSLVSATRASLYLPRALAAALAPWNLDGALASMSPTWFPDRDVTAPLDWSGPAAPLGGVGRHPGRTWLDGNRELGRALGWVVTRARLRGPPGRTAASFAADRAALIDALASGRTMAVSESWGDPSAVSLARLDDGLRVTVDGGEAWLVLRRDGTIRASGPGPTQEARGGGDGLWRTEIYRRRREVGLAGRGWVLWLVAGEAYADGSA